MLKEYFILIVRGDIDPEIHGPYQSEGHRDLAARKYRIENGDDDGVYSLDVSALTNKPSVSAYSGGFMDEDTVIAYVHLGCEYPTSPTGIWVQVHPVPKDMIAFPDAVEIFLKRIYEDPDTRPFPRIVKKWGIVGEDLTIPDLEESP